MLAYVGFFLIITSRAPISLVMIPPRSYSAAMLQITSFSTKSLKIQVFYKFFCQKRLIFIKNDYFI